MSRSAQLQLATIKHLEDLAKQFRSVDKEDHRIISGYDENNVVQAEVELGPDGRVLRTWRRSNGGDVFARLQRGIAELEGMGVVGLAGSVKSGMNDLHDDALRLAEQLDNVIAQIKLNRGEGEPVLSVVTGGTVANLADLPDGGAAAMADEEESWRNDAEAQALIDAIEEEGS